MRLKLFFMGMYSGFIRKFYIKGKFYIKFTLMRMIVYMDLI